MNKEYISISEKLHKIANDNNLSIIDTEYKIGIYNQGKIILFFEFIFGDSKTSNWYKKLHIKKENIELINKADFDLIEYL